MKQVSYPLLIVENVTAYLRGEVESQVTASKSVFNHQGHLLRKTESHMARQICSLAEVDKVFQGEGEGDGLREGYGNVLIGLLNVGVLTDSH